MTNKTKFWQDLKSGHFISMIKESSKGRCLSNSQEVYNVMKPMFTGAPDIEMFYCLFLDAKNKILSIEKLFSGSISSSAIYPREIIKRVLVHKATAIILVHNHPSGEPVPSDEDKKITTKIGIALASIDVQIHDHTIVGDGYFSMADTGIIRTIKERIDEFLSQSHS
jgi:DNA repair protein RadC